MNANDSQVITRKKRFSLPVCILSLQPFLPRMISGAVSLVGVASRRLIPVSRRDANSQKAPALAPSNTTQIRSGEPSYSVSNGEQEMKRRRYDTLSNAFEDWSLGSC
jgi:hypothetical protein